MMGCDGMTAHHDSIKRGVWETTAQSAPGMTRFETHLLPFFSLALLTTSALDSSVYTYRDIFTRGFRAPVHDHADQFPVQSPVKSGNGESVFNIPLDPSGLAKMFWSLDYVRNEVAIEVHAHLEPTQWMAVGFSDYGKLSHADLCVYWIDWKRKAHIQDAISDEGCQLMEDVHQDCKNFRAMKHGNLTKFMFVRNFDTCDNQDYMIEEGTTHIVYSIGDGPLFSINGVNISATDHNGMQRTQLLKNVNAYVPLPPSAWSFDVVADKVKVPNLETTYWCHVVELSTKLKQKHHVIQFEPVIQKGNEPLVHHMEIFHCVTDAEEKIPLYSGPCTAPNRPPATQVCKKVIAAWAMGATPFSYPPEAGLPIGGSDFNRFVMLEVHYNNPQMKDDWVDSSGVRVHVTDELRDHDAAVIELGLEYIDKMAIPPRQQAFTLSGYCITECTGISLPAEGIVIFGSQLHTHLAGVRVLTKHVRDGKELKELNRDNHYSTHFQEIRVLKERTILLPGDALITTCWYNTEDRPNITVGGFAISDEMCVNYVYYYPKSNLEVCKSSISDSSLMNYFQLMNELENQPTSPNLGITDNYKSIEWNPIRVRILDELYHQSSIYMQCNQSSGLRFPGDWSTMPLTRISHRLPHPGRDCP
ncbi:dopamine beta-hydroxylase [Nilaparvata lugens]|uniref:dopamine beta-hydroxylase n=1 Tax=Nilaparvata lugens TaxID=108931 RepID=UPI00193D2622|nr:dopamine beta-hydroxylase [Nilaparvata lugens]